VIEQVRRASPGYHACSPDALGCHPPSNERRTVAKHNSPAGFAVAQKADGPAIREDQIRKVDHDTFAGRTMSSD